MSASTVKSTGKYHNRETPDISHILTFYWFEPVLYLDPVAKFQGDFFSLYDAVNFQNKINISNNNEVDLQLGVTECNVYQTALVHPKSQSHLEHLHQLHILDKAEDDKSWECVKILKYSEEKD
jgi:hypothetical protein